MPIEEGEPLSFAEVCRAAVKKAGDPIEHAMVRRAIRRAKMLAKTPPPIVEVLLSRTRSMLDAQGKA